jgi:hypothetical protein
VWLVHALLVALEWCYSLNLLGGGGLRQIGDALRTAQATFTQPWLALVLAIAAVLLIYEGIVRRRVADSIGQAALTVAMIVFGLWLIADPAGTVGAVSRSVNDASLGTVAAIEAGTPGHSERTFADALGGVFQTTVTGPWCYLEFGNVAWCADPARVDPRLRAAATKIAADDRNAAGCGSSVAAACTVGGSRTAASLLTEANLLMQARTNGEFFLALPANGPMRNSINDERSLLRTICGTTNATACAGPSAAEAEFRTSSGTWPRAGGLLFVTIGTVGNLALLGFICLRLLSASLLAVLYLLLAPVAVLAPAFGDGGRAAFRSWSARLLGALVAKLVYSVLLGVVLLMLRILLNLDALGWWTQWLLIAAFWWVAFVHRHQLLGQLFGDAARHGARIMPRAPGRGLMRIARAPARIAAAAAGTIFERLRDLPPRDETEAGTQPPAGRDGGADQRRDADRDESDRASPAPTEPRGTDATYAVPSDAAAATRALDDQLQRLLEAERAEAAAIIGAAGGGDAEAGQRRERLQEQIAVAQRSGNPRRLASLSSRLAGVDGRIEERRGELDWATETLAAAEKHGAPTGQAPAPAPRERRASELDRQALLSRGGDQLDKNPAGRRDYPNLTALAGAGRAEYQRMKASEKRRVRLEIDRELERRREWSAAASQAGADEGAAAPQTSRTADSRPEAPEPTAVQPIARSRHERQFTRAEFEELLG